MKTIGLTIAFVASLVLLLPALTAQDEKKEPDKAEKKDPEKKDAEKKDEPKEPEKKAPEKKAIEKFVFGAKFRTKIVSIKPESNRELTIEMQEVDPKKVYDNNVWSAQRQAQLAKNLASANLQKDFKQRYQSMLNYQKELATYQLELAKRQQNIYMTKSVEVQAAETAKVRAMVPPLEFDEQGFEKKYTKKELDELRDKSGLPGFPTDFDALKGGQFVEIYMAKTVAAKKTPAKKKGPEDDDVPEMKSRPEYVLIVILPGGPR